MYRPEFANDDDLWRELISTARQIGVAEAIETLSGASKTNQQTTTTIENQNMSLDYKGMRSIRTEEEAIDFFEIDLTKWEISKLRHNAWDVSTREGNTYTNYQTRVDLEPISTDIDVLKKSLLEGIQPIKVQPVANEGHFRKYLVEIAVFDLHLGKVGFNPETLELNWSVEECRKAYRNVFQDLFRHVDPAEVKQFVLPVGNDMINIDSNAATTTKGTPQLSADLFQNLFRYAHQMVSEAILTLSAIAPVYVYLVPGNHDYNSTFSLGEVLAARFEGNPTVHVDNTPIKLKTHRFGQVLIGYHHGDSGKKKDYHSILSLEAPIEFGSTKYRYLHLGHLHKNQKSVVVHNNIVKDENLGVEVEICPSLSPVDEWHYQNMYVGNMRRSKSFIYDPDKGCIKEVYAVI